MTETDVYWKATRPDGTDFHTGTIDYAAALETGQPVTLGPVDSAAVYVCCSAGVLHASTVPTETLIGGWWPCRLFKVTGEPVAEKGYKRGFRALRVVEETDPHLALGPQGREVAALIDRVKRLTADEERRVRSADLGFALGAAWDAARVAAWDAARVAAWDAGAAAAWAAARDAARWDPARDATRDAARGVVVRDLIGTHGFTADHYRTLTRPLASVIGPLHPDDEKDGLL